MKLDHHVGKKVESVDNEGAAWRIHLEDGTIISSHKRAPKPPVEELRLFAVDGCCGSYTMTFGKDTTNTQTFEKVEVEVGKYEINGVDPHDVPDEPLPADPSELRVQDQPEGGFRDYGDETNAED